MTKWLRSAIGGCAIFLLVPFANAAETGFYFGGGIGSAGVDFDDPILPSSFDETDFGWKAFAGFNFDLGYDLGVEAGYVDFGTPNGDIAGTAIELDPTGFNVFGTIGTDIGPLSVFAKLGYVFWDADIDVGAISLSDDGNDLAYGFGGRFQLGSIELRGEYEMFDIEDIDTVDMLSASLVFYFE